MTDFSGEYELNLQESALGAPVAGKVQRGTVRIEHHEPRFHSEFAYFFTDGNTFKGAFELPTDGSEITSTEQGRPSVTTLCWDGDTLLFTARTKGVMTLTFRYELIEAGRRLRMGESLRDSNHDHDSLWIFDRK